MRCSVAGSLFLALPWPQPPPPPPGPEADQQKAVSLKQPGHRRSLARLRAADARLHQHDRNCKGEPVPERKRPYPLWGTSARDLAHAAPQLGVLITTSGLLAVLMLLSCAACLYPTIAYGVRGNFSSALRHAPP